MRQKLAIPTDFESINKEWLNTALKISETINQEKVNSFQLDILDAGPGQTGQLARFTLDFSFR